MRSVEAASFIAVRDAPPGGQAWGSPRTVAAVVALHPLHAEAIAALVNARCGIDAYPYDPGADLRRQPLGGNLDLAIICGWGATRPVLELVEDVSTTWTGVPLLVIADGLTAADVRTLSSRGVSALLDGDTCAASIACTVGQVLAGEQVYAVKLGPTREHDVDGLSGRQLDVLRLLADGRSNREIAERLCISVNTVKYHVHSILTELRLRNRTEAARIFVEPTRTGGSKTIPVGVGGAANAP